jgi:mannose/cellobiose epimerase-like protein (N-acyl-D-glucosamine 2-epimerase family)
MMNKRKITTRVIFDGVVDHTVTQMRQVYTDEKGEYINCMRNKYHLVNDSFDIVYTTGRAFTFAEVLENTGLFKE